MADFKGLPVIVAGGGLGGLATALALARAGFQSEVLERRPGFSEEGAGIQIGPNGVRILERLGVAERLAPAAAKPDALNVRCLASGRLLARLPLGSWMMSRHGAPYWTAHRQDVHAALLDAAEAEPRITIRGGCEVTGFHDGADAIEAICADDSRATGRALVGADGLWSRLRAEIAGSRSWLRYAGKCAFRSVVERAHVDSALAANEVSLWIGPGAHVVHYPVRAGAQIAVVVIVDDGRELGHWAEDAEPDMVLARAQNFPAPLRALLTACPVWRMWSLGGLAPPLERWARGRAGLLGDAAHPMLPFFAQGAVQAFEDAAVLADCLKERPCDAAAALTRYQALRRRRALRVVEASVRNGKIYHLSGAGAAVRNAVMRIVPGDRLMARYDWLYGWRSTELRA